MVPVKKMNPPGRSGSAWKGRRHCRTDVIRVKIFSTMDFLQIAFNLPACASTFPAVRKISTAAGIHSRYQLHMRRVRICPINAADCYAAILQRLPQDLYSLALELCQFIQKEDTAACKADLPGLWQDSSPDQRSLGNGMVRASEYSRKCTCTSWQIKSYLQKISQPMLERMDICVETMPLAYEDFREGCPGEENESSGQIRERVERAH